MLKFTPNTRIPSIVFGFAALVAIAASQVTPSAAQGVPAGLLRLDPPTPTWDAQASWADFQQPRVRSTYAYARKHHRVAH
jgi:hypothetical protein